MPARQNCAPILAALIVGALFVGFAGDGLGAYFTPDDMMNLYLAWSPRAVDLIHSERPVGALFHRALFTLFGLNPLPYRIVCFTLLLANLALLYAFSVRLSRSREVAALACLLGAYHAHLADLYYSTGTIYDLLCCLFFLLAFVFYVKIREAGGYPTPRQNAALISLDLLALGSKEMAVVLPVFVVLYEWIYQGGKRLVKRAAFLWLSIPVTAAYIVWKTTGEHRMTANPAYAVHVSLHAYFSAWKPYLNDLFYGAVAFNSFKAVLLWALLASLAMWTRRRELLFAFGVIMAGVLPFIFIAPRGFFVMYLTLPGWYLYAGSALVWFRDLLVRHLPRLSAALELRPEQVVLFVAVAALLIPLHRHEKPLGAAWLPAAYGQVRPVMDQLARSDPTLPPHASILFLSDPYPADDWILKFMFCLHYRDKEIRVDRVKVNPALAQDAAWAHYDRVFVLDDGGLREVAR